MMNKKYLGIILFVIGIVSLSLLFSIIQVIIISQGYNSIFEVLRAYFKLPFSITLFISILGLGLTLKDIFK